MKVKNFATKIKGFLFAVRHREILMTDLGLSVTQYKKERDGKRRIAFFHPSPYFYVCRAKA